MATTQQEQQNCIHHFWQRIRKTEYTHECVQKIQGRESGYPTSSYNLLFGVGLTPAPVKSTKESHDQSKKPLGLKTLQADIISTHRLRQSICLAILVSRKLHISTKHYREAPPGSRIPRSAEVGPPQRSFCCWQIPQAI